MNVKLIIPVLLVGGVWLFYGIHPSYLLDQGSNVWHAFSADSAALVNGEAKERLAQENRRDAGDGVHEYYAADPATTDEDVLSAVRDASRDLSEAERTSRGGHITPKGSAQPAEGQGVEELARRLKDQHMNVEELTQHLKAQNVNVEELTRRLKDQNISVEELPQNLNDQSASVEELKSHLKDQDASIKELKPRVRNQYGIEELK